MTTQTINPAEKRVTELAVVVERLTSRLQAGEPLDIHEIVREYPQFAEELTGLLPAMAALASLPGSSATSGVRHDSIGGLPAELGDYRILREVGRGGMGIVYEAKQLSLGRRVALKVLPFAAALEPRHLERFQNEAKAAASLRHEHIVHVYGVGCEQGVHYYAMEFIEGQTLAQHIRTLQLRSDRPAIAAGAALDDAPCADAPTPPAATLATHWSAPGRREFYHAAATLIMQAAQALEHAHQLGIVHRDVKPGNLLLDNAGGLWVSDFGLAHLGAGAGLTVSGDLLGTLRYMSPEQASGKHGLVDHRTDVYSLGATLYELLTLRPALTGVNREELLRQVTSEEPLPPRRLDRAIPAELETVVLKAMAKEPARRYATAGQLAADLQRFLAGQPIQARPVGHLERAWRGCRRNPLVSALAAAVVLVAAVGLFGVLSQWQAAVANEQKAVTHAAAAQASAERAKEQAQEASQQRDEARRQQAEAQRQRDEVQRQRDLLGAANEKLLATQQQLQSTLYAAHINLAQREWDAGVVARVLQLLDQHRPKPGQADLRGFEWHYLNRLCHSNELTFEGCTGNVYGMALSRDAKRFATALADHTVKVWDAQTGKELLTLKGHLRSVAAVVFSPDGRRLASASSELTGQDKRPGEVKVWDVQTGRELVTLKDTGKISCLALSADNKHLAIGSSSDSDGTIKIWDAQTARQCLTLKAADQAKEFVAALAFSPDGKRLAAGIHNWDYTSEHDKRRGGKVKLWDTESGREPFPLTGHSRSVNSVLFSPDGKRLASGSMDATVKVWNSETGQELLALPGHTDENWPPMAYSPDGRRLAVGCDNTVKLWDAQTGQELATLKGLNGYACCLALSDDGRCLAGLAVTASSDGTRTATIKAWETRKDREGLTFKVGSGLIDVLAYSPDGTRLAVAAADGPKLLDANTGKETVALKGRSESVSHLAFSPDGKRLAASSSDKTVKVWDTQTGRELVTKTHATRATGLAFSPDGKRLASASWNGNIKLWDAQNWTEMRTIARGAVGGLAFTPDGKRLAGALTNNLVRIWDPETGRLALTLRASGSDQGYFRLAMSPDGQRVAGGGRTLFIWDAQTGRQLFTLDGHTGNVSQLAFSPDGKRLVSADYGSAVKLWDSESGRELLSFQGGGAAAFGPDGRRLAIGTRDGTVEICDATPLPEKEQKPVQRAAWQQVAEGWAGGSATGDYEMALDTTVRHGGRASARIKSNVPVPSGFAQFNQKLRADDYRGKRLRLSGYVKTENAEQGAWLWMGLNCETEYVLDNMHIIHDRRIKGTRDWRTCDIVLDVPKDALAISIGVGFSGAGQAWFDDLKFEIVGPDVPVTSSTTSGSISPGSVSNLPAKPLNLDFESQRAPAPPQRPPRREVANGWTTAGPSETGLDSNVRHGGNRSAFIKSKGPEPSGFASFAQRFRADDYRGKRLRLSGYVKTENAFVDRSAYLWMQLECKTKSVFDNMRDRPITGTRDWKIYDIVLDVPEDVVNIYFGFTLTGTGQAWFDDFQFEIVGPAFATTGSPVEGQLARQTEPSSQAKPLNLDFEE